MHLAASLGVDPYHVAASVDPQRDGAGCAGEINRSEIRRRSAESRACSERYMAKPGSNRLQCRHED